jgi:cytochrome c-type biogenesis protein CcmE
MPAPSSHLLPQAAEILQRANERYTAKDLMAAMKLYEDALNEVRHGRG